MLNQYGRLSAILLISVVIVLLSNNFFLAGELLLSHPLSAEKIKSFRLLFPIVASLILSLLSSVAVMPLRYGKEIWFYENAKKNKLKVSKILFAYNIKYSFRSIKLCITLFFIKLTWSLFFLTPAVSLIIYLIYSLNNGISGTMIFLLSIGIALSLSAGVFFLSVMLQRYILVFILFHENSDISPIQAIRLSGKIMDDKCFRVFSLKAGFAPWFLLCLLIFPAFYVYPYYKISVALMANDILTNYER